MEIKDLEIKDFHNFIKKLFQYSHELLGFQVNDSSSGISATEILAQAYVY